MPRPALNLARRPFLNRRPVLRAALLLAAAAGAVLLLDAVLYGRSLLDLRALGAREDEVRRWLQDEQRRFDAVRATPEFRGLAEYNRAVRQLNALIAERTFPWGQLFDQLSAVLPPGVRLQRLAPAQEGRGQRRREAEAEAAGERVVLLSIDGVARSDEELYAFVDALFAADAFRVPVLTQESQEAVGRTFTVQVQYLTNAPAADVKRPASVPAVDAAGRDAGRFSPGGVATVAAARTTRNGDREGGR